MIGSITSTPQAAGLAQTKPAAAAGGIDLSGQFGQMLNNAIGQLGDQQAAVDALNTKFVSGEGSDVHQLMIASQKLSLGLELTVQVRNKVIEAYQEMMRMQL